MFHLAELRVHPHAFRANPLAEFHDPDSSPVFFDFSVHQKNGLTKVLGARYFEIPGKSVDVIQDIVGDSD
jgi:hypothetical protein